MNRPTLKQIQEMVDTDLAIDRTELEAESARSPQIHNKYLRLYTETRNILHSLRLEKSRVKKLKWLYYNGKLSQEELEANNLEPFQHKILKTYRQTFLDADDDLQKVTAKILMNEEIENYLDKVLSEISNRRWTIRNMIEWLKFTNGVN